MPYSIIWVDAPGDPHVKEKKQKARPAHIDYMERKAGVILASGGFFPDDDDFPNGGLIVLDVETRQEAIDFAENDPFKIAGVYHVYEIRRWKKFIWDHKRV